MDVYWLPRLRRSGSGHRARAVGAALRGCGDVAQAFRTILHGRGNGRRGLQPVHRLNDEEIQDERRDQKLHDGVDHIADIKGPRGDGGKIRVAEKLLGGRTGPAPT